MDPQTQRSRDGEGPTGLQHLHHRIGRDEGEWEVDRHLTTSPEQTLLMGTKLYLRHHKRKYQVLPGWVRLNLRYRVCQFCLDVCFGRNGLD